jgi:hypothetical protein
VLSSGTAVDAAAMSGGILGTGILDNASTSDQQTRCGAAA